MVPTMDDLFQNLISHLMRPESDQDWAPDICSKVSFGNHTKSEWIPNSYFNMLLMLSDLFFFMIASPNENPT